MMASWIFIVTAAVSATLVTGQFGPDMRTCADQPCGDIFNCVDGDGFYQCICKNGKTGSDCTLDNPCTQQTENCPAGRLCYGICNPNVVCSDVGGQPQCYGCVLGWTGEDCLQDRNECADGTANCQNGGTCENLEGSYKCTCPQGFSGQNCECAKGTECYHEDIVDDGKNHGQLSRGCSFLVASLLVVFSFVL